MAGKMISNQGVNLEKIQWWPLVLVCRAHPVDLSLCLSCDVLFHMKSLTFFQKWGWCIFHTLHYHAGVCWYTPLLYGIVARSILQQWSSYLLEICSYFQRYENHAIVHY